MTASIDFLPIWKKDATAFERLCELAEIARKYPDRFDKFVIGYVEKMPSGNFKIRNQWYGCQLIEAMGVLEFAKNDMIKQSEK